MRIDRTTRVFFDASCLVAAAGRADGGSGFVVSLCERGLLVGVVSIPVLREAEVNVAANLPTAALARYQRFLQAVPFIVLPSPGDDQREAVQPVVGEKDAHVLAAVIAADVPFLLTLDRRLALAIGSAGLPIQALSPGTFITGTLIAHAEFEHLRG